MRRVIDHTSELPDDAGDHDNAATAKREPTPARATAKREPTPARATARAWVVIFVESKRWLRFLLRSARSGLLAVSTHRKEKRGQREAIGEERRPR